MGGATLVLLLGLVELLDATPAAGAASQPGTVSCKGLSGTIRFDPPLKSGGTAPEVLTGRVTVDDCTAKGGAKPRSGKATIVISAAANTCTTLESGTTVPITFVVKWSKDGTSSITFPGFTPVAAATAGFSLGGAGTTVSGSYPGSDAGASSTATVVSDLTTKQIVGVCGSEVGLKSLKIVSGTLSLG
jgi:hypothetical protein